MLKKIIWLVFGLGASLSVVAYQDPYSRGGLELQLEGLYLRNDDEGLKFAALTAPNPMNTPNSNGPRSVDVRQVNTGYKPAFKLGIGYLFPCTCSDLWIDWIHLSTNDSNSVIAGDNQIAELPFFIENNDPFQGAKGNVKFKYDAIDLNLGQRVNFCNLNSRIWFGLCYARINRGFDYSVFQTELQREATSLESIDVFNHTRFRGIGPQFGVDSTYELCNGFGLVARVSVAGLVGKVNTHTHLFILNPNSETNTFSVDFPDNTRLVPSIDGKVGAQYKHHFCNGSIFKICAGYQFVYYFDAINDISLVPGSSGVASADTKAINVNFPGPFLSLELKV